MCLCTRTGRCSCPTTTTASCTASATGSEAFDRGERGGVCRRVLVLHRRRGGRPRGGKGEGAGLRRLPRRGRKLDQSAGPVAGGTAGADARDAALPVPGRQPQERPDVAD